MKRLSPAQQKILAEMTWDARASVEDVARRLKLRAHTVRHAMKSLQSTLKLTPMCWTHPYLRGQSPYRVFFSLDQSSSKSTAAFLNRLSTLPEVVWLASLIGHYQFVMGVRGASLLSVVKLFTALDDEFRDLIVDRTIAPILQMGQFVPWVAHAGPGKRRCWEYKVCDPFKGLDETDNRILKLLSQAPLATVRDISQGCGLPNSTVSYRLERMVSSGVIIGFAFAYDDRLLGRESALLSISTHGFAGGPFETFFDFAQRHPQVSWVAQTVGAADLEIGVILDDAEELHQVVREISALGRGAVKTVHSHALIRTLKC